jgi:two-component system, OmpR family, response regulator
VIRVLWIGLGAGEAPIGENPWYINDFAVDLADAELFTLSRRYDAMVFARVPDSYGMRRYIDLNREDAPHTLLVGLESEGSRKEEREFFEAGGHEYIPLPQCRNEELVRLRIERYVLRHFCGEPVEHGMMRIEPERMSIAVGETTVKLPPNVFKVFYKLFLRRPGIVGKEELLSVLYENPEYMTESVIEYAICHIRDRIDRTFGIETIRTIRNRGYGFVYNS